MTTVHQCDNPMFRKISNRNRNPTLSSGLCLGLGWDVVSHFGLDLVLDAGLDAIGVDVDLGLGVGICGGGGLGVGLGLKKADME